MSDAAYTERNRCVALILMMADTLGLRMGLADATDAEPGWSKIAITDLPSGQVSWHIPDSELWLFSGFPAYTGKWDGHSTEEKYQRVFAPHLIGIAMRAEATRTVVDAAKERRQYQEKCVKEGVSFSDENDWWALLNTEDAALSRLESAEDLSSCLKAAPFPRDEQRATSHDPEHDTRHDTERDKPS